MTSNGAKNVPNSTESMDSNVEKNMNSNSAKNTVSNGTKDMTEGSPAKLILFFSIPILIGNIFQQLYSMVDTIIVGRSINKQALAAVGLTGPMNFLILGFVMGLTGGFAVIVAQRYGARDENGVRRSVAMIILLCIFTTIIMTLIAVLTTRPLLRLINTPDDIIEDAYNYIVVIYWGIVATVLYNMLACILRALGDSKTPLYFLIISSFLNIGLDFLFILNFKMGVAGAAWATVVSQGVSGILCLIYTIKKYPILHVKKEDFKWNSRFAWKHMAIGLPMAFQFSITAIGVVILQGALNLFGSEKIAAYTAASKVEQLVTQPASTFGVTMANYAGQNLGAAKIDRIKEGVSKCTIITLCFSVAASIILLLLGRTLAGMFITAEEAGSAAVLDTAQVYLRICAFFFPFLFMIFVYRNVLQGTGHSFMPLMAGVFELVARSAVAFILPNLIGFKGICYAGPVAWIAASVPLGIAYFIIIKKMLRDYTTKPLYH